MYSDEQTPMLVFAYNENIYAQINGDMYELYKYNLKSELPKIDIAYDNVTTVRVTDYDNISTNDFYNASLYSTRSSTYPQNSAIALSRTEEQGNNSWCAAYAAAAIIRTVTGKNVSAMNIATYALGSNPSTEEGISKAEIRAYAATQGLSISILSNTLSTDMVRGYIVEDSPIYLSCYGGGTKTEKNRHALVLRGYDDLSATYTIWNPWNQSSYYVMRMSDKTHYHPNGATWTWDSTIFGG